MLVKGIIKTVDYKGNTCTVRIPFFESAGNNGEVVIPATFSTIPGIYNGYKVDDVVFVTFENETLSTPVVIGKLYLGAETEGKDPRGAINAENLKSSTPMSLPLDTKLILDNDPNKLTDVKVQNGLADYKTIADIVKGLQKQTTEIGSMNVKLIDTGEEFGAEIKKRVPTNSGEVIRGLSWHLDTDKWEIDANDEIDGSTTTLPLMTLDRSGMVVYGDLKLLGYPATTEIRFTSSQNANVPPEDPLHPLPEEDWHESTAGLFEEGYYIWKRTREVYWAWDPEAEEGAGSWTLNNYGPATYECITGATGASGEPAITVQIINEFDSVPCDSEGNPISGYNWQAQTTHQICVFAGTTAVQFKVLDSLPVSGNTDYVIVPSYTSSEINYVHQQREIAANTYYDAYIAPGEDPITHEPIPALSVDNAKITYNLYKGTTNLILASCDFDITKRYAGENAMDYYVLASAAQITKNPNTTPATIDPQTITFTFYSQEGGNSPEVIINNTFGFGYILYTNGVAGSLTALPASGILPVNITNSTQSLKIELYDSTDTQNKTLLDVETVNVISDGQDGAPGDPAVSYWLALSHEVHTGVRRQDNIEIVPWMSQGSITAFDSSAVISYKWRGDSAWTPLTASNNKFIITAKQNKDLLIKAEHSNTEYAYEEIPYSPLNTPIINLSPDTASLPYTAAGPKIGSSTVSSTAKVYLNGDEILDNLQFSWTTSGCSAAGATNTATIVIESLTTDTATATCQVSNIPNYSGLTLTKAFTITKQFKGDKGDQGIDITNLKNWYLLWPESAQAGPTIATPYTEPPVTPNYSAYLWSTTPPNPVEGYQLWMTTESIFSDDTPNDRHITYTAPVKDVAYVLAQGKSTNYYSDNDPSTGGSHTLKKGDCWFCTGYYGPLTAANSLNYISNYVIDPSSLPGQDPTYLKVVNVSVDPDTNELTLTFDNGNSWIYYDNYWPTYYQKDILLQYTGNSNNPWIYIEGEQWANKLTANYINALNITAKRIHVLNSNNTETLFLADGLSGSPTEGQVEIAGFTIGDNSTEQQYKYILFKSAEENPSASGIVGIHYTQEECDEYNTEHDLSEGDEGFRTTDDWKEAPGTGYIGYYIIKYIPNIGFKYRLVETVEDLEGVTLPVATYTRAIDGIGGGKYLRAPFESDLGTPGSVFISPEYKGTIPTLDNNRQGWAFIAGENFGVNTDGQLFAYDATLKQYVKFTPTVTSSDPEHPVDVQDELRISAQQTDFGTITIRCFVDYKHEQEWSFDHYKPEVFDPLDPGWIDITDPGWGGGGSSGGGSSSGGGGGFTPLPGPGHNTGPSGGGTTF